MGLRCRFSVNAAETMDMKAIMDPIDRSILPEISTKVRPTALMIIKELSINMLKKTWGVPKPVNLSDAARNAPKNRTMVMVTGKYLRSKREKYRVIMMRFLSRKESFLSMPSGSFQIAEG